MSSHDQPRRNGRSIELRLAGAPISWGACEVPGWGPMPDADRVLAEMAALGLKGTELGAIGFLPQDPDHLQRLLERHELQLVGGFVPLVLHEPRAEEAIKLARAAATVFEDAGATIFVLALVSDMNWSAPVTLDDDGWRRLAEHVHELRELAAEHGLTVALHPHAGTLIESGEQVQRALSELDVGWCLDTGHLLIGGVDPAEFACGHGDRVVHAHLKDVDGAIAGQTRSGKYSLVEATKRSLFLPLGRGDARIGDVLRALDAHRYDGWLVLEQDTAITGEGDGATSHPMRDALTSIAFLRNTDTAAPATRCATP